MHNPCGKLSIRPTYLCYYPIHSSISSILLSLVDKFQPARLYNSDYTDPPAAAVLENSNLLPWRHRPNTANGLPYT